MTMIFGGGALKTTTLYLTRHGQTEWNVGHRMQGHLDSPLTELGVSQASWLGEALVHVPFDAVYASSSPRAIKTAELLLGERALPIMTTDALREIGMGDWEGRSQDEIKAAYPEPFERFWSAPHEFEPVHGGESYFDHEARVLPFLEQLVNEHEGETVLVVTHAGTLKRIMTQFAGLSLESLWADPFLQPTALCKVAITGGAARIELYGDTSHYKKGPEA